MGKLKVYYGWAKLGKIRKKRAISVIFDNEWNGCRSERGQRILRAAQETVIERYQDAEEEKAAKDCSRIFTEYSLFLDEKPINGSLNKILQMNSDADKKHVSKEMRDKIAEALRKAFMQTNRKYREPGWQQLELKFE
jgi:signal transduction protein with GAF and PtsI domain